MYNNERMAARKKTGKSRYLFWTTYGILLMGAALIGGLVGAVFGFAIDLPRVEELQEDRPSIASYVYSDDNRVLGQFALEKRILVSYHQIPEALKLAVLSAEDANFFRHSGIDFRRLLTAAARDILLGETKGASTLTMQLSKLRFTSMEKTLERKIKDFLYAIEIEKSYSKEQIFTFYCNQVNLGHGQYGVAAAADYYFGKSLSELTLAESALLAGMIQRPASYSPINHPQRAVARRNWVLQRMHELGHIDDDQLRKALEEPLVVYGKNNEASPAPYFVEMVRQYLAEKYTTEEIWERGLRIYTTLDYDLQVAAQKALRNGLKEFDRRTRRWAGPVRNLLKEGQELASYSHPDWQQIFYEGQLVHGLVLESSPSEARVKLGSYTARVEPKDVEWTGRKRVDQVLQPGDVAVFVLEKIFHDQKEIEVTLEQIPLVQGALVTLDNRTGAIRALVGGFDFQYSKFNRATQALRQPGSIFKPFTYVAAMEAGFSPSDQVLDAPVSFQDALGREYSPVNSDGEFKGLITIRQALAGSRNIPTVRLANALGPEKIVEVAHRFGIRRDFPPYLSLALGAGEVTLLEMTSAFTTFPNHGLRAQPFFIQRVEDYNGVILEEYTSPRHEEVLTPEIADKMIYLLRGVVEFGTATRARELNRPVAGKTGTTNDSTDSWFIGFTPQITAGVWVGFDEKKSLGERVFGATLALPIWVEYMKEALKDLPVEDFQTGDRPADLNLVQSEPPVPAEADAPRVEVKKGGIVVEDITPPQLDHH